MLKKGGIINFLFFAIFTLELMKIFNCSMRTFSSYFRFLLIGAIWFFLGSYIIAQTNHINLQKETEQIINFLEYSQQKENHPPNYYKGEWPSYIENIKTIPLLGKKGKKAYDSNCMVSVSIFVILAEYYIQHPDNNKIKDILYKAIGNFEYYRIGEAFHFWHELERTEHLQKGRHKRDPKKYRQRRANVFYYKSRLINAMMNLAPDSDDAANVWLSYYLFNKIFRTDSLIIPDSPGKYLDEYSDINRENIHFYNFFKRHGKETGAFLTWMKEEKKLNLFRIFPGKDFYIPFGVNDIDAVVNANIVYSLKKMQDTLYPSYQKAMDFINYCFETNKYQSAGNYYPTKYNLHYITCKAFCSGCTGLEKSLQYIYSQLKSQQLENGSYPCQIKNNELQASIFALNSMIYLKKSGYKGLEENINKVFDFVFSKKLSDKNKIWWTGGIYFSGGTFVRKSHVWKSDAYTTALVLEAVSNYYE